MAERASDAAYSHIKRWIMTAELAPNSLVDEAATARKIGTSRTPVREALLRLQSEGLVEIGRGKGIRVLPLTSEDMRELYQVISGLETLAVGLLAARRPGREALAPLYDAVARMRAALAAADGAAWGDADEDFHRGLLRLTGNRRLYHFGSLMRDLASRAHLVAVKLQPDDYKAQSERSHADVIELILAGDPQAARESHFRQRVRGEEALVRIVEKYNLKNL